jgi:hypothetical protein
MENSALPALPNANGAVMRVIVGDQHVAVEAVHFGMANTPMPPKDCVSTGSTSPSAT